MSEEPSKAKRKQDKEDSEEYSLSKKDNGEWIEPGQKSKSLFHYQRFKERVGIQMWETLVWKDLPF